MNVLLQTDEYIYNIANKVIWQSADDLLRSNLQYIGLYMFNSSFVKSSYLFCLFIYIIFEFSFLLQNF